MMNKNQKNQLILALLISLFTFFIMCFTVLLEFVIISLLIYFDLISSKGPNLYFVIIGLSIGSIFIGTLISFILGRIPLKPVMKLIEGMQLLADGHYETRIHLGKNKIEKDLTQNFNHLANELQNTELLRTDFVNNFSHEFKTPIVSIKGFAKILRTHTVSKEKENEYLDIITQEAERLSDMATNVLNLSKIEKQVILTDVQSFNVSEQIRNVIILLEKKWSEKNIQLDLDFDDYSIEGNEELLKQVWINLLDNAIKFCPQQGCIQINIHPDEQHLSISIINNGPQIPTKDLKRIFEKFYQSDISHASKGNGIGLSIVSKIVSLHHGEVHVTSDQLTTFTVVLPKNQ